MFFDAATTQMRADLVTQAIEAGKHIYCEKPVADSLDKAVAIAKLAKQKGIKNGVVQDKLFLPGLRKIKMLRDAGFFGRMLSVRGEFGYWVFEGDWGQPAQRPSWNYKKAEGGGIILDMLCHWRYVLDNLFGEVQAVSCLGATHIPSRVDENGKTYTADTDDAAYATFQLEGGVIAHINSSWATRLRRDDLVTFHVDGTHGSAVAGLTRCVTQSRVNTPRPVWNPDVPQTMKFFEQWEDVPDNITYENGFKIQWEDFIRHVVAGYAVEVRSGRRRQGRAACRARPEELGRAALDRRAGAEYLRRHAWRRFRFPTKDRSFAPYTTGEPIVLPKKGAAPKFNRVAYRGRACGRRSARRQRSVARRGGRLGQDHRVPRISLGPRARRRRSDGHRAARHGARLERRQGADPPRARRRARRGPA